jgi:hypothetical protein
MKTNTLTNKQTQIDTAYETSKFALATTVTLAALIGVWASACMISGLLHGGVVRGYIMAVTGV